jgi:hypothetical protein
MNGIERKIIDHLLKIFPRFGLGLRINKFMRCSLGKIDRNGVPFGEDMDASLKLVLTEVEQKDARLVEKIKRDMVRCYLLYGMIPEEYYLYDCRHESESYIKTILSYGQKDECCNQSGWNKFGKPGWEIIAELSDKWAFYNMAKPYFKRDVCKVDGEADFQEIENFCKKHNRFIAKPRFKANGIGVHIVDLENYKNGVAELFDHYKRLDDGKWLFEEIIIQDPAMAAWHESSVNTIRVPSIRTSNGCKVLLPLFRTGKNGNVVDNCHNDGGLMAVPDADTGVLITDGYDVFTNVVEKHPNSGLRYKGWRVPRWDELMRVSSELHESLPKYHQYVGFDFALTPEGWVVIEGNWGNFPHQVCVHHGIKKEFEALMNS